MDQQQESGKEEEMKEEVDELEQDWGYDEESIKRSFCILTRTFNVLRDLKANLAGCTKYPVICVIQERRSTQIFSSQQK